MSCEEAEHRQRNRDDSSFLSAASIKELFVGL